MVVRQQVRPNARSGEITFNIATPKIDMIAAANANIHRVMPHTPGDYKSSVGVIGTGVEMDLMKAKGIPLSRKKKRKSKKNVKRKRKTTNKRKSKDKKRE